MKELLIHKADLKLDPVNAYPSVPAAVTCLSPVVDLEIGLEALPSKTPSAMGTYGR